MLKAFRQNSLLQIIVILLVIALLWLRAFVDPTPMHSEHYFSPIYELLLGILQPFPQICNVVTILIIIIEAVWLNLILANNKLNKANWLMPTLLFVLAACWRPDQMTLSPALFTGLPILAAINQMLTRGNTTLEVDRVFNAAFCFGIAILCFLPNIVFVVPLIFVLVTYKLYRWRDHIVAILGITAPAFLLFFYAFLTDRLDYYIILIRHDIVNIQLAANTSSIVDMVTNAVFIILLLVSLFSQLSTLNDKTLQHRINTIILILPLIATLLLLPYDSLFTINTQFATIPFAFLTANYLATDRKRKWINDILFSIIILALFFNLATSLLK